VPTRESRGRSGTLPLANEFKFSTKQADRRGQLIDFGFRWYDPEVGRFTQRDPIGLAGGLNLYAYCGGNPVDFLDRWGLEPASGPPSPNPNGASTGPGQQPTQGGSQGGEDARGEQKTANGKGAGDVPPHLPTSDDTTPDLADWLTKKAKNKVEDLLRDALDEGDLSPVEREQVQDLYDRLRSQKTDLSKPFEIKPDIDIGPDDVLNLITGEGDVDISVGPTISEGRPNVEIGLDIGLGITRTKGEWDVGPKVEIKVGAVF